MRNLFRKKRKNRGSVLSAEVPQVNLELNTEKLPKFKNAPEPPMGKLFHVEAARYEPPTDKEIIEALEFQDNYEAAYLIKELKKQNAALKGKLTKLTKKCNAYKEDLDNTNATINELINLNHGIK